MAETVRDASGTLTHDTHVVTLSVPEAANGGFVTALCPYTSGMSTCSPRGQAGALKGSQSGLCADVPGASQTNGTQVAPWDCHGQANQTWTASPTGQLTVYGGAKCLDAKASATTDGTPVQIYDCNGTPGQQWRTRSDGTIVNVGSGKCLDTTNNDTGNGTQLELRTCDGDTNQIWTRS